MTNSKIDGDINTHLYYMARDIAEIKKTLSDAPSRKEMDDVKLKMAELELEIERVKEVREQILESWDKKFVTNRDFRVGMGVVGIIITIAVTLLSFWDKMSVH